MTRSHIAAGKQAEEAAIRFLRQSGYRIISRNVRCRFGEIDVVAKDGSFLCFVEVKARSSERFGYPEEAVSYAKQWRLVRLAQWYLQRYRLEDVLVRFDVVSILGTPMGSPARIRLIKGAFDGPQSRL